MSAVANESVATAAAEALALKAKGCGLHANDKLGLITHPEQLQAFFQPPAKKAKTSDASASTASGGATTTSADDMSNFTGSQLPPSMSDVEECSVGSEAGQPAGQDTSEAASEDADIPATQPRPVDGAGGLDDKELMEGIQNANSAKLFEKATGVPLTEEPQGGAASLAGEGAGCRSS
jgi:hypothetical protein